MSTNVDCGKEMKRHGTRCVTERGLGLDDLESNYKRRATDINLKSEISTEIEK